MATRTAVNETVTLGEETIHVTGSYVTKHDGVLLAGKVVETPNVFRKGITVWFRR